MKDNEDITRPRLHGEKVNLFDESLTQNVTTFNHIFNMRWGGDQKDSIEIGEVYTHLGRVVYRNGKPIKVLFNDEDFSAGIRKNTIYDVYNKTTGEFIMTYKALYTIARDYGVTTETIGVILNKPNVDTRINIKITRRKIKESLL